MLRMPSRSRCRRPTLPRPPRCPQVVNVAATFCEVWRQVSGALPGCRPAGPPRCWAACVGLGRLDACTSLISNRSSVACPCRTAQVAGTIAELDVLAAFAEVAASAPGPYVRPTMLPPEGAPGRGWLGLCHAGLPLAAAAAAEDNRVAWPCCGRVHMRRKPHTRPPSLPPHCLPAVPPTCDARRCRGRDCAARQPAPVPGGAGGGGLHPQRLRDAEGGCSWVERARAGACMQHAPTSRLLARPLRPPPAPALCHTPRRAGPGFKSSPGPTWVSGGTGSSSTSSSGSGGRGGQGVAGPPRPARPAPPTRTPPVPTLPPFLAPPPRSPSPAGGKSTYIRQVGLAVLMAQAGR